MIPDFAPEIKGISRGCPATYPPDPFPLIWKEGGVNKRDEILLQYNLHLFLIVYLPHPLYPPLLSRRGGRKRKRGRSPS